MLCCPFRSRFHASSLFEGWQTKIFQLGGSIYRVQLHERAFLDGRREFPRKLAMENSLGFPAAERLDYQSIVNNAFTTRQGPGKKENRSNRYAFGWALSYTAINFSIET
ncbi:MAG: hypothetical protein QOE96_3341 [Blastocatellia bacterium]|nr:hypothetical protein [Blastocatellia bacterium]